MVLLRQLHHFYGHQSKESISRGHVVVGDIDVLLILVHVIFVVFSYLRLHVTWNLLFYSEYLVPRSLDFLL